MRYAFDKYWKEGVNGHRINTKKVFCQKAGLVCREKGDNCHMKGGYVAKPFSACDIRTPSGTGVVAVPSTDESTEQVCASCMRTKIAKML